jgi:hypothetical protein
MEHLLQNGSVKSSCSANPSKWGRKQQQRASWPGNPTGFSVILHVKTEKPEKIIFSEGYLGIVEGRGLPAGLLKERGPLLDWFRA